MKIICIDVNASFEECVKRRNTIEEWLTTNNINWMWGNVWWLSGEIEINDPEDAIMFRLKFGI